jgi:hypothetical protein
MSQIEKKCLTCTEKKNKKKQKLSQPTKKKQKNAQLIVLCQCKANITIATTST